MQAHTHDGSRLQRLAAFVDILVIAAAAVFMIAFVGAAVARARVPAPLTDVGIATVQHVQRVLDRQPLYPAPDSRFVPLDYPPLYYYAAAPAARLLGAGYPALRLTSLVCTLLTFAVIAAWAWRETGSWRAAVIAAGLYAATYRMTDAWFDVERVDALFVALLIAALYVLRFARNNLDVVAAAGLFVLSALTKQTAWLVALPVAGFLSLTSGRRGAIFAATLLVGGLASTALFTAVDGRWYAFFVYGLGSHRFTWIDDAQRTFAASYDLVFHAIVLVVPFGLLAPLVLWIEPLRSRSRIPAPAARFLAAAWCGVTLAAVVTRVVQDSRINVLMPVFAVTAVAFAVAVQELARVARAEGFGRMRVVVLAACLTQFIALAYIPWHLVSPIGPERDDVFVITRGPAGPPRVTVRALSWTDAPGVPHADFSAVADLLAFAPSGVVREWSDGLVADLCRATDDRPVVVSTQLFDAGARESLAATAAQPVPLPPTIDAALSTCRRGGAK